MYFNYNGVNIFYNIIGSKGSWLLFLHGWGGNGQSFFPLYPKFSKHRCLSIDFPPFGNSAEPLISWDLNEYVKMVYALLKHLKIKKVKIISHSFGGRVAILLASNYNIVERLVLVDTAGIKPRKSLIVRLKIFKYKLFKKLGIQQKNSGSIDYKLLSQNMKKTFVITVNQYLEKDCQKITCKTLIIFGKNDKETPVYMAKKLHKLIPDSQLVLLENAGHYSYLDKFNEFVAIVKKFFKIRG